jgi:hypothetical protein
MMMDLKREWTIFALEAEYDAFGMVRIVKVHNQLLEQIKILHQEIKEIHHSYAPNSENIR